MQVMCDMDRNHGYYEHTRQGCPKCPGYMRAITRLTWRGMEWPAGWSSEQIVYEWNRAEEMKLDYLRRVENEEKGREWVAINLGDVEQRYPKVRYIQNEDGSCLMRVTETSKGCATYVPVESLGRES